MSNVPPGDPKDDASAMPWSSAKNDGRTSRGSTLVGAVIDPSVNEDGLGLVGPGAPQLGKKGYFGKKEEHPVRARLLERARRAREGLPPEEPPLTQHTVPYASAPVAEGARDASEAPSQTVGTAQAPPRAEDATTHAVALPPGTTHPLPPVVAPDSEPKNAESTDASAPLPSLETPLASLAQPSPVTAVAHTEQLPPSSGDEAWPLTAGPEAIVPPARLPALTPPPGAVATEIDQFARRSVHDPASQRLSPNMTAALGALVGLTVVVSLGMFMSSSKAVAPLPPPTLEQAKEPEKPAEPPVQTPQRTKVAGPWRIQDDANKPGHRVLAGKIGREPFLRAIQDAGLPKNQAYRAYGALKGELDLDHCSPSDTFLALVQGRDKTLIAFEYIKSKEDIYQVKVNPAGQLEGKALDLAVLRNQIRRAFVYDGKSFEDSARRAGFDPGISQIAEQALRGHSTLADFKRGDRVKVIAQEVTVLGEFSRYAGIEALEILRNGAESRRIYYYPHAVEGGHFDKDGRAPYEGGWRKPIPDAPRTSPFNPKRMHPVLKKVLPHNGTDYGAPSGTPIGATGPGVVTFIGMAGRSGNLVKVKHSGGYESGYAHMSRFAEGLKVGDSVDRMQLVGYCGNTGSSTAPHLHFSMKKDGKFIDPESLNLDGLRVLPKDHRPEFALIRQKYDPILDQIPTPAPLAPAPGEVTSTESAASAQLASDTAGQDEYAEDESSDEANLGMGEDPTEEAAAAATNPAPARSPGPSAAPAQAGPNGPAAAVVKPSAIFLSDAELLKMQSLTDDGEVPD